MSPRTVTLVQSTFAQVIPIADVAATLFYDRLFTLDPALRSLFPADLSHQKRALMATLRVAVDHLDRLDELIPVVEQLGVRHAGYGVRAEHYPTVGAALLGTLEQGLGPAFTPAARAAWAEVYDLLATTMRTAAARAQADESVA